MAGSTDRLERLARERGDALGIQAIAALYQ
jgi:hypothetical protein